MSDPLRDLKRELLAAAERQQGHAAPAGKSHRRWFEHSDVQRGGRRRRLVALAAAALVVAVGTASAIGSVRDFFLDGGFIGLPPVGATPSAPESGELIASWEGLSATLPRNLVHAWLYADGRVIWERRAWHENPTAERPPEGANELVSGYLEQRLTQEGVELVRSEVAGLFDRTRAVLETVSADDDRRPGPFSGLALFVPQEYGSEWGSVEGPDGDRRVRLGWQSIGGNAKEVEWRRKHLEGEMATPEQLSALRRVDALLTDPASVLPPGAWAVREVRAYVPSHYAVCIDTAPPKDAPQLLSLLPARAGDLLEDKSRTSSEDDVVSNIDQEPGHMVVVGRSVRYCYKVETEEARQVADALTGLVLEPGWGSYGLAYRVDEAVDGRPAELNPTDISFEPYFPNGQFPFSGPSG